MELSSYFASYFGWQTSEDYFIGGLFMCIAIYMIVTLVTAVLDDIHECYRRYRREKICQLHHSRQASEPCHIRDCPAARYCTHYWPLTFKERITRAFGKKKKP